MLICYHPLLKIAAGAINDVSLSITHPDPPNYWQHIAARSNGRVVLILAGGTGAPNGEDWQLWRC